MCVTAPERVLSSAFLRTVSRPGDENVDWQRGTSRGREDIILSYYQKCSAQVGQKHIWVMQNDYSAWKKAKDLTNIWGLEGVGRHLDQWTRGCLLSQFFCKEKMKWQRNSVQILVLQYLWSPHAVEGYAPCYTLRLSFWQQKICTISKAYHRPHHLLLSAVVWGWVSGWAGKEKGQLDKKMEKMEGRFQMLLHRYDFLRAYLHQTAKPLILAYNESRIVSSEFRLLITYISCSLGSLENTFASMTSKASFCEISLKKRTDLKVKILQAMVKQSSGKWNAHKELLPRLLMSFKRKVNIR